MTHCHWSDQKGPQNYQIDYYSWQLVKLKPTILVYYDVIGSKMHTEITVKSND